MQKPFSTQPELFVTSADLEHPSRQVLDGAEAVLDWQKLEQIMAGTVGSDEWRKQVAKRWIGHELASEILIHAIVCGAPRGPRD